MFSIKIKGHNRSESQFKGFKKKTLRSETVREVKVEPHTHTHTHTQTQVELPVSQVLLS